jgi:hypothetical protein
VKGKRKRQHFNRKQENPRAQSVQELGETQQEIEKSSREKLQG